MSSIATDSSDFHLLDEVVARFDELAIANPAHQLESSSVVRELLATSQRAFRSFGVNRRQVLLDVCYLVGWLHRYYAAAHVNVAVEDLVSSLESFKS